MGRVSSGVLIGREAELSALADAVGAAVHGSPSAMVISGEAGIGKTRLVREVKQRAHAFGAETVMGGCIPLAGASLPYAPVIAALRQGMTQLKDPATISLTPATTAELARLLPELGPLDGDATETDQMRLFDAVLDLIRVLTATTPLVFVIEDVHWSDAATRDLLTYLLNMAEEERVLFLCSIRTGELDPSHPVPTWIRSLASSRMAEIVELLPLSLEETRQQMEEITGFGVGESVVGEIYERSEGNPFFVEELLQAAARGAEELPPSLRDLLLERIRALSPAAIEVVKAMAVDGPVVPHDLLAAATSIPEDELTALLQNAIDHHLLVRADADGYSFRHALLRETVYGRLLPGERRLLHRSFAEARENLRDRHPDAVADSGRLARHWHEAGEPERALPHALSAAAEAERSYAPSEALQHHRRAIALWDEIKDPHDTAGVTKVTLLHRAGAAAERAGDLDQAVELYQEAIALVDTATDPALAADLRSALVNVLSGPFLDDDAALPLLKEAQELVKGLPRSNEKAQVLALTASNLSLAGRLEEGLATAKEAMAIAERIGDGAPKAGAHVALALALRGAGDLEAAREHLTAALEIARGLHDGPLLGRVAAHLSETLFRLNRIEHAITLALSGVVELARLGDESYRGFLKGNAAECLAALGRWDQAEELAVQLQSGPALERFFSEWLLAQIDVERGRFEQARTRIKTADLYLAHTKELRHQDPVAMSKIALALWERRYEDASGLVQRAWDIGNEDERSVARLSALGVRVEADRAAHARAAGAHAVENDASRKGIAMMERCAAAAAASKMPEVEAMRYLTEAESTRLAGRLEPAPWMRSIAAFDRLGYRYQAAYVRYRCGEVELTLRNRVPAGRLLAEALDSAREIGAAPLALEIEGAARRGRVKLSAEAPARETGKEAVPGENLGLTKRELEVLRRLSEGLTNKQIAESLFISPKTASIHVSNILTKLGVSSRVEAARRAYDAGLLERSDRT